MTRTVVGLIVLGLTTAACGAGADGWRAQVVRAANVVTPIANAAGETALEAYCRETMSAIGREGRLARGPDRAVARDAAGRVACEESGPRAGTAATEPEQAALATARARWRPLRDGARRMHLVYVALLDGLRAGAGIGAATVTERLLALVSAYGALVGLARERGMNLPALPGALAAGLDAVVPDPPGTPGGRGVD